MMEHPECYYEWQLKDKCVKEVTEQIREMCDEIDELMEEHFPVGANCLSSTMMCPSPELELEYYKEYFDKAIQALFEAIERQKVAHKEAVAKHG